MTPVAYYMSSTLWAAFEINLLYCGTNAFSLYNTYSTRPCTSACKIHIPLLQKCGVDVLNICIYSELEKCALTHNADCSLAIGKRYQNRHPKLCRVRIVLLLFHPSLKCNLLCCLITLVLSLGNALCSCSWLHRLAVTMEIFIITKYVQRRVASAANPRLRVRVYMSQSAPSIMQQQIFSCAKAPEPPGRFKCKFIAVTSAFNRLPRRAICNVYMLRPMHIPYIRRKPFSPQIRASISYSLYFLQYLISLFSSSENHIANPCEISS